MTTLWQPVPLSKRQVKEADRVGGADLVLPWPEGLPRGPALALDEERDATPAEHRAAEQILGAACRAAGLVPARSVAAMLRRPPGVPRPRAIEQHLVVWICGYRWVHATGRPPPGQCWSAVERIARIG